MTHPARTIPPARPPAPPGAQQDPYVSVEAMAARVGVSRMTIYRAISGRHLRSMRVGRSLRVRESWFLAWLRDGARTGGRSA